jgi:hypothetical protein
MSVARLSLCSSFVHGSRLARHLPARLRSPNVLGGGIVALIVAGGLVCTAGDAIAMRERVAATSAPADRPVRGDAWASATNRGGTDPRRGLQATITGTITLGGSPVTVTISTSGDDAALTFSATAGQRAFVNFTSVSIGSSGCCSTLVSIRKPDGTTLSGTTTYAGTSGGYIDTVALPVGGTYTVFLDPQGAATGSATVTAYDVPADLAPLLQPTQSGAAATLTTSTPGQNIGPTFSGTAGQRVFVNFTGVSIGTSGCCSTLVSIRKPDGTTLSGTQTYAGTSGGFIDRATLPVNGTYTIFLDPQSSAIGGVTVTAYDVPADPAPLLQPTQSGAAATLSASTPGQNIGPTFSGTAGQRVFVNFSAVSIGTSGCCSTLVSIRKPDGTTLSGTQTYAGTSGGYIDTATLPMNGTYTIFLDPQNSATGSATVTAYVVPADATDVFTEEGDDLTVPLSTPGQNGALTFDEVADEPVSFDFTDVTVGSSGCCSTLVKIKKPDGTIWNNATTYVGTSGGNIDMLTAPTTGTYTLVVDPQASAAGTLRVTLHPPRWAASRYMDPVGSARLYELGFALGEAVKNRTKPQYSLVVLDYGCQTQEDGVWGASSANSATFHTMSQLRTAVESFGEGYYYGVDTNWTAQLEVQLGTNNDCTVSNAAGQAWANSIDTINSWFANHGLVDFPIARQVLAGGANDFEAGFCLNDPCPANAKAWASGYASAGLYRYDNYGSCSGCPPAGTPDGAWTQDDYWYLSWGASAAYPLPEIYANNGVNAAQWERISEYGVNAHGWAMRFDGALTQDQACAQRPADCNPALDNTAAQGWKQLWKALNSIAGYDNHVPPTSVHGRLKYSSDIAWTDN